MSAPRLDPHLSYIDPAGDLHVEPIPPERFGAVKRAARAPVNGKELALEGISAFDLARREFPEPRWAVPGLIPAGLSILAGKPKVGKSWALLGLGIAAASGGVALGHAEVTQQGVLYLALEDTPQRLQVRQAIVLSADDASPPARLVYRTTWPRADEGGIEALDRYAEKHPETGLVIVDTIAKVRPASARGQSVYEADYKIVGDLKGVADRRNLAVLCAHHLRKQGSDDIFDSLSGSLGLTGAADAVLVLERKRGDGSATLHLTGRDVEEVQLAVEFRAATCTWHVLGDAREVAATREQRDVLELLAAGPKSAAAVGKALGISYDAALKRLQRMTGDQLVYYRAFEKTWAASEQAAL